jgi:Family of unknown function (DUF6519)
MPSDKSRSSHDIRYNYSGVVTQQGRVILDRDFNALQQIVNGEIEAGALDIIGPCGTPDNGFAVSLAASGQTSPPLWSPPAPLSPPGVEPFDFLVSPGTMYLGGERAVLPTVRQNGEIATYSYFDQPDWINPTNPFGSDKFSNFSRALRFEAVYLHVVEQEVSAAEDPDLLDVALGGPDTTQRLRLMRYIRRQSTPDNTCADAFTDVVNGFGVRGLTFDAASMRLLPAAKLQVSFTETQAVSDPCDPTASGGYLGEDNQLIRVQIVTPGSAASPVQQPTLAWGYDNASFIYRVAKLPAGATANVSTLQLGSNPVDAFHTPIQGQLVEVLRTTAVLESEPDQTAAPGSQSTIVRCVAEPIGKFFTLARPYDPSTQTVVLNGTLPSEYAIDPNPLFMRVWQGQVAFDPTGGTPAQLTDLTNQGMPPGLQVAITVAPGSGAPVAAPVGAYWMIAVRPSTPQGVYPEQLLVTPQPPDGPRQWICPLAVIDWTGATASPSGQPVVTDCRQTFDNLVDLSKRGAGCCRVSVSPNNLGAGKTLQSVIDQAVGVTQGVTVCLNPGVYIFDQPLRLSAQHSRLTLEACGGKVVFEPAQAHDPATFSDGLIVVEGAAGVTLRGIDIQMPSALMPAAAADQTGKLATAGTASNLLASITSTVSMIGLNVVNSPSLTVEDCDFLIGKPSLGSAASSIFAAQIFLRGNCPALAIHRCTFSSDLPPSFTLLQGATPSPIVGTPVTGGVAAPLATTAASATPAAAAAPAAATAPATTLAPGVAAAPVTAAAPIAAAAPGAATEPISAAAAGTTAAAATAAPTAASAINLNIDPIVATTFSTPGVAVTPVAGAVVSLPTLSSIESSYTTRIATSVNALQTDLATTAAAAAAIAVKPMVITLGCLAALHLDAGTAGQPPLTCSLANISIRDNTFLNLTLPIDAVAEVATVRLQDNDAKGCIGGFWFELTDSIAPQGQATVAQFTAVLKAIATFREVLFIQALAASYPLPTSPTQVAASSSALPATTATFFITNNQIDALPAAGQSSMALMLLANRAVNTQVDTSVSMIISSNRFANQSQATLVPTVLLVVADAERCALTGNLIFNQSMTAGAVASRGGSLIIIPNSIENDVQLLAVSGNALLGWSDLSLLNRTGGSPPDTWVPYNATT